MAIKFDELLEALDPSLDKFEENLDSMWIIIPTERRYDDLTADDYFKFAKKYGTFNNQKDCFDKIEELAPDRWDAFIPMKLEGVNESLTEDSESKKAPKRSKKLTENLNGRLSYLDIDKLQEALAELDNKDISQVIPHPTIDNAIVAQISESYILYINDKDEVEVAQISDTGELLNHPRVIATMAELS